MYFTDCPECQASQSPIRRGRARALPLLQALLHRAEGPEPKSAEESRAFPELTREACRPGTNAAEEVSR